MFAICLLVLVPFLGLTLGKGLSSRWNFVRLNSFRKLLSKNFKQVYRLIYYFRNMIVIKRILHYDGLQLTFQRLQNGFLFVHLLGLIKSIKNNCWNVFKKFETYALNENIFYCLPINVVRNLFGTWNVALDDQHFFLFGYGY